MIREEKYKQALWALHQIFVQGRFMAFRKESYDDIANLLDYAEIMPKYIASEDDETERFLRSLESLAKTFPKLQVILDEFNAESNPFESYK